MSAASSTPCPAPVAPVAPVAPIARVAPVTLVVLVVLTALVVLAGGCPPAAPAPTSPEALRALLSDRFWAYELVRPATTQAAPAIDSTVLWFGSDGRYEAWFAENLDETGSWSIPGDGLVTLDNDVDATDQILSVTPLAPKDGAPGVLMGAANGLGIPMHEFRGSDGCPALFGRADSRLRIDRIALDPVKGVAAAGQAAVAVDDEGDVHLITSVSYADEFPTGYYATSVGARCGVVTYLFDGQSGGKLAVDDHGGLHAAYVADTLRYAWRPAQAPASVPWETIDLGPAGEYGGQLSFAVKPDGGVAIVAAKDFGYRVLKSDTPLDPASWVVSTLPLERSPGALLNFAATAGFDSRGQLYVAGNDGNGGSPVLVFRDDDAWTPLVMAPPPRGVLEGPSAFAFDASDRLYFVSGDLGIAALNNAPPRAGDLWLGTALLDGAAGGAAGGAPDGVLDEPVWRVVGTGGRASLVVDRQDRVQIYSSSRLTSGWHTIVPPGALALDDASGVIERYPLLPSLDLFDWPALGVGRGGETIFAHPTSLSLVPRPGALQPLLATAPIRIDGDIGGGAVVFPDLDVTCTASCDLQVPAGRWLQWRFERGQRDPFPVTIFGSGVVTPDLNPGGGGTWGVPTFLGTCVDCSVLELRFAAAELLAHALLTPEGWAAAELLGPVTAHAVDRPAVVDVVQDTRTGAQLQRFGSALAPLAPLDLPGWSTVADVAWDTPGLVVLSGATTAQTTIGDEAGFAGEGVVVGVRVADDDAAAPAVAWVWRDEAGAARTTPRFLRRVSQGTALLSGDSVVVIADDGALVRRTALPGLEELVGLNVVVVDDDVHVIGAVGASVNEAWTRSRWLVVDSAGALTADREIDGTVLAAQAGPAPATPGIVVAFGLTANQPWDGGFVLQTALAGAKLLTNGAVQARGAPVTLPPEVGSGTATIVSLAGAPSTTRRDGSLDVALTFFTGATTLARVDDDGLALVAGYGNPTTNVTARFEVRAEGLATLGDSLVLGARVTGTVPFNNASITHTGPVLFELP